MILALWLMVGQMPVCTTRLLLMFYCTVFTIYNILTVRAIRSVCFLFIGLGIIFQTEQFKVLC
jgi:hypothetical protein